MREYFVRKPQRSLELCNDTSTIMVKRQDSCINTCETVFKRHIDIFYVPSIVCPHHALPKETQGNCNDLRGMRNPAKRVFGVFWWGYTPTKTPHILSSVVGNRPNAIALQRDQNYLHY